MFSSLAIVTLLATGLAGCAAQTSEDDGSSDDALVKSGALSVAQSHLLMELLTKANAPSNTPQGMLGVGSRIARVRLTTAQGGMAHFISEGGELSTVEGADLGNFFTLGGDWSATSKALLAGGAKWATTQGEHGASSGTLFATVECKQVVAPGAKPRCTAKPIDVTQADSNALMEILRGADAPSNTPPGMLGVGSRIGKIEITTAQGGMAHFISQGGQVTTLAGKHLADLVTLGEPWSAARDAVLDGGATWKTVDGAHGASSSTMTATVECSQVVSPTAKPRCTVTPEIE